MHVLYLELNDPCDTNSVRLIRWKRPDSGIDPTIDQLQVNRFKLPTQYGGQSQINVSIIIIS